MQHFKPLLALFFAGTLAVTAAADIEEKRQVYRETRELISSGQLAVAQDNLVRLQDYPLRPYLEADLIEASIDNVSSETVDHFLAEYGDTVAGRRLRQSWLSQLAKNDDWDGIRRYAGIDSLSADLRCAHASSLWRRARNDHSLLAQADQSVTNLWLTPSSLPRSCDDVFDAWLKEHPQRDDMVWSRARLAIAHGETGLARYLLKKVSGTDTVVNLMYRPMELGDMADKLDVNDTNRTLVAQLLRRIAALDYQLADKLWPRLDRRFDFSRNQNFAIRRAIARHMIADGNAGAARWLERKNTDGDDEYLLEWQIRLALRDEDWTQVRSLIAMLSPDTRTSAQWQYWLARANIALHRTGAIDEVTHHMLAGIARERGFYSFLAADLLQTDYNLQGSEARDLTEMMQQLAQVPAVQRARELHALDEHYYANLEWRDAVAGRSDDELTALMRLAREWNWHQQAILTALRAGNWDDLETRFPLAYRDRFAQVAESTRLQPQWLYAIARQESAFAPRAISPAGALGVMQLLPATARHVARRDGIDSSREQLFDHNVNIALGGSYLNELLQRFNGNQILATAAYNAGPSAIEGVLQQQLRSYPADVWIETLPYSETRNYVKNVLAFSVIYAHKLGDSTRLLAEHRSAIEPLVAVTAASDEAESIN